MIQFVQNELEMGATFASLALDSQTEEKRRRNQENARKAYDTAKHFLENHAAAETVAQSDLFVRLSSLRNLLIQLGEKFE